MSVRTVFRGLGVGALGVVLVCAATSAVRAQQGSAAEQKIAAIKSSLGKSMAALRSYEWIETVTVKVGGEQKSQKKNRCYYGADGKQEKVPLDDDSAETKRKPRGVRGRIVEKKSGEMEDYIQKALGLVKQYIPPDAARLQEIKTEGAQQLEVLDNATRLRADFPDYLKSGDRLSVDVDPNADRILGISVASYIDDNPKDAVTLQVTFATFQDGTSYPEEIALRGESKDLDIVIENAGYRKSGS